jgi:hypothetical protein
MTGSECDLTRHIVRAVLRVIFTSGHTLHRVKKTYTTPC